MIRRKPILIAEDDEDDRYFLTLAFNEAGLFDKLKMVEHGEKIFEYLDSVDDADELPGLIVLDINMPRLGGMETLVKLKASERYKHIPVVILSTANNETEHLKCIEFGAAAYMVKPNNFYGTKIVAALLHNFVGEPMS